MGVREAAKLFQAEWIGIRPERCLNPRHRMEFCDACSRACPQDAIRLSVENIEIEPELCNNCGLCVADCPTGALEHDYFSGMRLLGWAKGRSSIHISCQRHELEGALHAEIPCHGMLDEGLLMALKALGVDRLHLHGLGDCEACPTRIGRQRLDAVLAAAGEELPEIVVADAGEEISAIASSETPTDEPATASSAIFSEPVVDRRAFLSSFGKRGALAAMPRVVGRMLQSEEAVAVAGPIGADEDVLQRKHVPDRQQLELVRFFSHPGDVSRFHRITASEACTGCQVCAIRCPTGALSWEDEEDQVQLRYHTAACIGCGLCVSLCPYDALTLESQQDAGALESEQGEVLFESRQLSCENCGDRFLPHDGDNRYCWICKNEREMDDQWMSFLKAGDG